jgi:hypothetical protein
LPTWIALRWFDETESKNEAGERHRAEHEPAFGGFASHVAKPTNVWFATAIVAPSDSRREAEQLARAGLGWRVSCCSVSVDMHRGGDPQ